MKTFILSLMTVGLLSSCGAIINGSHQDVFIGSNVSNAMIYVDGKPMGATPTKVELARDDDHMVKLTAKGYEDTEVKLHSGLSGWLIGSVICGGLIGVGIDFINGGAYTLDDDDVTNIKMKKK